MERASEANGFEKFFAGLFSAIGASPKEVFECRTDKTVIFLRKTVRWLCKTVRWLRIVLRGDVRQSDGFAGQSNGFETCFAGLFSAIGASPEQVLFPANVEHIRRPRPDYNTVKNI